MKISPVPGTRTSDETQEDKLKLKIISGFSEPILPLGDPDKKPNEAPISAAVSFAVNNIAVVENMPAPDATLLLPFQTVGTTDEGSFVTFLRKQQHRIREVNITQQHFQHVGAYQFRFTLK